MADRDYIPLMFQAQVGGRSQIHKLEDLKEKAQELGVKKETLHQQAYDWAKQWQESCDTDVAPAFGDRIQTKEYTFTWRMVTNGGQDEGVIRPVIGERGWAYFPGSSMKGAFRRACTLDQKLRYCGGQGKDSELHPGILRFHGGYPKNDDWLDDSLVDLIHPQEDWQLNGGNRKTVIQLSLYQPTLVFGISSVKPLSEEEWSQIWQIWEAALGKGIGSRVSAGYGQIETHGASNLLSVGLQGQGLSSKRIDGEEEFRPNGFKAALRGHTRRLFCGVTDDVTAENLTKQLWGGLAGKDGAIVGLLGVAFSAPDLEFEIYRSGRYEMPLYDTGEALLNILLLNNNLSKQVLKQERQLSEQDCKNLRIFITQLVKFSMLLGGFGKSWRRIDHRLFFPNYLNRKPMIGCHWEFTEESHKRYVVSVNQLTDITSFLDGLQRKVAGFPLLREIKGSKPQSNLREAWQKGNVEVWGRIADDEDDSLAIRWFHDPYQAGKSIQRSELTGKMGQIGRIWHRMYPRYRKRGEELVSTGEYVELLTVFPNRSGNPEQVEKTQDFLKFLADSGDFTPLW
jgi:CRISPR-associated protein Cmr6